MNLIGYDAAALGNHEFNYGIATLRTFESQLELPAARRQRGRPGHQAAGLPAVRHQGASRSTTAPTLKVGILGLTNPGIAIWDKANVEGKMEFPGLVEQAKKFVPELKAQGLRRRRSSRAHSGADTSSSYGDALPYPENAATLVAEQVPGRRRDPGRPRPRGDPAARASPTRRPARRCVLSEPLFWGKRLSRCSTSTSSGSGSRLARSRRSHLQTLQHQHRAERPEGRRGGPGAARHRRRPTSTPSSAPRPRRCRRPAPVVEDVPIIDFINYVQARRGQGGADRRRREPAGALDRRAVQPGGVVPAGRRHDPRRGGPLHLRQHAARREGDRRPGEGLPGVLGELLQAGHRHRPGADRRA